MHFVMDKINSVCFLVACNRLVPPSLENAFSYSFGINLKSVIETLGKPQDCKHRFITKYYNVQLDLLRLLGVVNSSALI